MELPFKYIVLKIIKELRERNMPLKIDRSNLINYFQWHRDSANLWLILNERTLWAVGRIE